ncbi:MAG TPA: hypothetical protein VJV79_29955 [Polyangiaceae bacterium]|nr:hypothetical protein [Polyangiaceae bacterium]
MSERSNTFIGLTLGVAVSALLPILIGATAGGEDLAVRVEGNRLFDVRPSSDSVLSSALPTPTYTIEQHLLPQGMRGLDLTTWSKTYGGAYAREVTWSSLVGPLQKESDYVCGYSLSLGAGLFDTSGAGAGLQRLVEDALRQSLPKVLDVPEYDIHVPLPDLESAALSIRLGSGAASMAVSIRFVDASTFSVVVPVRIASEHGAPAVRRAGRLTAATLEGPLKERLLALARSKGSDEGELAGCLLAGAFTFGLGCIPGAMIGAASGAEEGERRATAMIPGKAEAIASEKIDTILAELGLGFRKLREPFHPFPNRPGDELSLRLDADPHVDPSGIGLSICVRAIVSDPKIDAAVPGAVAFSSPRLPAQQRDSAEPVLSLAMNADAINQVVHFIWQAGILREVGESSLVLDSLAKHVRMAAFDFTGLDPALPPTLSPIAPASGGSLPFVLGNVELGSAQRRTVIGHAQASLGVVQEGDSILLRGTVDDIRLNCAEVLGTGVKLTPCLADLLPVVRSAARDRAKHELPLYRFSGTDVLGKLPQLGFQGMRLRLWDLRVRTEGTPARVDLNVHAEIK